MVARSFPLSTILRSHLGGDLGPLGGPELLEPLLQRTLAAARQAWPGLLLGDTDFLMHLAKHWPKDRSPRGLALLHCSDLYLACACARGEAKAISVFEQTFFPKLRAQLTRRAGSAGLAADAEQFLRSKLFLAQGAAPPRIAGYSGKGSLLHWTQAVMVRAVIDLRRAEPDYLPLEDSDHGLEAEGFDPEHLLMKAQTRRHFKSAFRTAAATLSPEQRNLLRLHAQGVTFEKIGALYGVHRSTALRRVAAAHQLVLDEIRRLLAARLQLGRSELDSLMRLAESQLEVSLGPLLESGE